MFIILLGSMPSDNKSIYPENEMGCSLARDAPLIQVSCKSGYYFVSNPTDEHTTDQYN